MKLPEEASVGARVRSMRKARGLTQVQLAKRARITQATLSDIETGVTSEFMASTLAGIAAALEINPDWLRTGETSPVRPEPLSVEESELVALFRGLQAPSRGVLLTTARAMLDAQPSKPSRTRPYPIKA